MGLPPRGGSTFFRSERKYQRKQAARRLQRRPAPLRVAGFGLREPFGLSSALVRFAHPPGKSPLLPIFERGSSQCRAQHSWLTNSYVRARSCSLFSSFKKGKAFSLRCLSPLCSPAVGVGQTYPLRGDFGRPSASGFGGASHEARRRMAVYAIQAAGSRTRPASRGTRRATAVKPRPGCFPTSSPAPYGRGVG